MRLLLVDIPSEASFERPELRLHAQWSIDRTDALIDLPSLLAGASQAIDLVVVYQDRPKQLSQAIVSRCLAASPLTRIVQVLGPWCDGDLRTPGRLSGVFPVSFRDAQHRLASWIEQFRVGVGPLVRPLTNPEPPHDAPRRASQPLKVAVRLTGRLKSGMEASLAALGHTTVESTAGDPNFDVLMVDGDAEPQAATNPRVLALYGFSRSTSLATLAKTASLAELESALAAITVSKTIPESPTSQSHTTQSPANEMAPALRSTQIRSP